MSVKCNLEMCLYQWDDYCHTSNECPHRIAHNPAPNESVSSARTRGSLTAPHGQSESETTAPQLAHSLPAPVVIDIRTARGCKRIPCGQCISYRKCYPSPYFK